MNRQPQPHFLPRLLFKGLWLSPHCGHLACAPRGCLPTPTPEQDCALSFHGRVHHPCLFLSLREDQYTTFWDMGLPRQSLTPLSGHSFMALQIPRCLCYSVSRHPPLPALPRRHHLKPAFGGTPPPLSLGTPYTSNTLPARDCKTPLGYCYSIATFDPSTPRPFWVPRLGFSLCWPALLHHLLDCLYYGRILPPSVYLPHLSPGEYPSIPR